MRTLFVAELVLWTTGAMCAGACALVQVQAAEYRSAAGRIEQSGAVERGHGDGDANADIEGDVLGRIEIPALGFSAPITRNDDGESLRHGIGHIPGTAMPGGLGTVGLAGHRDTFFRPLRRIGRSMDIRLMDTTGTYHYLVDSTEVVSPDKVQVLDIAARPELTLVTCFPFDYVGAAPRRFIVHAHLLSASPDRSPRR